MIKGNPKLIHVCKRKTTYLFTHVLLFLSSACKVHNCIFPICIYFEGAAFLKPNSYSIYTIFFNKKKSNIQLFKPWIVDAIYFKFQHTVLKKLQIKLG